GVESGTHAVPELSRVIGSATLMDDCIDIMCSCSELSEWRLSIFASVIPHFGHSPGSVRTTSGCIAKVYNCGVGAADAAAKIDKNKSEAVNNFKIANLMSEKKCARLPRRISSTGDSFTNALLLAAAR